MTIHSNITVIYYVLLNFCLILNVLFGLYYDVFSAEQ